MMMTMTMMIMFAVLYNNITQDYSTHTQTGIRSEGRLSTSVRTLQVKITRNDVTGADQVDRK